MQDSPTLVPVSELIGICIDIEQPDTIIFVPNVPSSTPLESAGTTTMSNVSACTPPLLILETCNTQWRYSELPEHVLVLVFSYLRRHEIARGEKRVVRGEWPETQIPLSRVCRRWNSACKHDSLWSGRTQTLYKWLTGSRNAFFNNNVFNPHNSLVNPDNVYISDTLPNQLPTADFRIHYIQFRKDFDKKYRKMIREASLKEWKANFFDSLCRKYQPMLQTLLSTIGYLGFLLFIVLCVLRERLSWTPYIYLPIYLCLSFVPLTFAVLASFAAMQSVSFNIQYDTFRWKPHGQNMAFIIFLLIILDIPILLTALNVGVLPLLPDILKVTNKLAWERRWGLLPWHVIFAPLILIFFISGIFFTSIAVSRLKSLRGYWNEFPWGIMLEYCMFLPAGLAGFCFSLFFTLLGFHLEFPYQFHLAICFSPLYLVEIFGVFVFSANLISKCKTKYSSRLEKLTLFCYIMLPISLMIGNVIVSLYQFLFAYAYLGLLIPATSVFVILLLYVNNSI